MWGTHDPVMARALQVLADAKRNRSEVLAEAVPEALKNALLVMAAQGTLTPAWTVRGAGGSAAPAALPVRLQHGTKGPN